MSHYGCSRDRFWTEKFWAAPRGGALRPEFLVQRRRLASRGGPSAPPAVAAAIERLCRAAPDVIVIARGGDGRVELDCWDTEVVARAIASATVPVWTAIGHAPDATVADRVANRSCPTSSAAAADLVSRVRDFERHRHERSVFAEHRERAAAERARTRRARLLAVVAVIALVVVVLLTLRSRASRPRRASPRRPPPGGARRGTAPGWRGSRPCCGARRSRCRSSSAGAACPPRGPGGPSSDACRMPRRAARTRPRRRSRCRRPRRRGAPRSAVFHHQVGGLRGRSAHRWNQSVRADAPGQGACVCELARRRRSADQRDPLAV
jgi:predicted nucleic acid-binding Zn ribbon protein